MVSSIRTPVRKVRADAEAETEKTIGLHSWLEEECGVEDEVDEPESPEVETPHTTPTPSAPAVLVGPGGSVTFHPYVGKGKGKGKGRGKGRDFVRQIEALHGISAHPGKGPMRRQRDMSKGNLQKIGMPTMKRLARRGGVRLARIDALKEARDVALKSFLSNAIERSIIYAEHAKRKTISCLDVVYALKGMGRTIYGFGDGPLVGPPAPQHKAKPKEDGTDWVSIGNAKMATGPHFAGLPINVWE